MHVLIKGMKMPKCCDECPMLYEYRFCALTDDHASCIEWKLKENRMPNCPLIPIPDHGDLIDRDALMANTGPAYYTDGHDLYAVGTGTILRMPVVIPAERSGE